MQKFEEYYVKHMYIYAEGEQQEESEEEREAGEGAKLSNRQSILTTSCYQS